MSLAPEQVRKEQSTLQADIWQLGCCFALLLALACGGTRAAHSLRHSIIDPPKTQGCFGIDGGNFLAELDNICGSAQHLSKALEIVKSMLIEEPESRSNIHKIFAHQHARLMETCA